MLFIGDDWAEAHHDVKVRDEEGRRLVRRRLPEGVVGIATLHALLADHLGDGGPGSVAVGIETDRGPWVQALLAAGYQVFAINPMSVARYRDLPLGVTNVVEVALAVGGMCGNAIEVFSDRLSADGRGE